MFRYCPACASEKIQFEQNKVFRCPDCGLTYYHNTAAATACIVRSDAGLLFLVRNKEPCRGKLDLPGGFVDPGEGVIEGLRREFIEELNFDLMSNQNTSPAIHGGTSMSNQNTGKIVFFASFPNTYPYKNFSYNTCDLFFYLDAPDLTEKDLKLEAAEISAVRFIKPRDLDMEEIAFESVKKAVRLYIDMDVTFDHG